MSDHNFEKQIRQKLDELKIPPADTVWSSVEAQIRKDKRRRRGLTLYPLLVLLLGAGSYFIFENHLSSNNSGSKYAVTSTSDANDKTGKTDNSSDNIRNADKENDNPRAVKGSEGKEALGEAPVVTDKSNALAHKQQNKKGNKEETNGTRSFPTEPSTNSLSNRRTVDKVRPSNAAPSSVLPSKSESSIRKTDSKVEGKSNQDIIRRDKKNSRDVGAKAKTGNGDTKRKEQPNQENKGNAEQLIISDEKEKEEASPLLEVEKKGAIVFEDQENTGIRDSLSNKLDKAVVDADYTMADSSDANNDLASITKPADTVSSDAVVHEKKTIAKKVKQSSWKWGFTGSAGISNLNDGSFFDGIFDGIGGEKSLVADVSPNAMNNNAPSPTAVIYRPSSIENGFSFSIGGFMQKNMSKRFSLATSVQYRYYSTNIQVGNRIDSTTLLTNAFGSLNVTQYYRSAPVPVTYDYTNRFHFIEVPVTANFQLSKRLPVYWNAGLSLSYLVSTNVLHFDSQTGVYYKDNSLLNKLQANLSTGLSVSFWNKSKMPVHVGPQVQYGLTNLMKRDVSAAKHLFYFGLNTKLFLKK